MVDQTAASVLGLASSAALATGSFVGGGNITDITIGFDPRYFVLINVTDGVKYEKLQGMPTNACWKSGGGASGAVDTTSAVLFSVDDGQNAPGQSIRLAASVALTGKLLSWACMG